MVTTNEKTDSIGVPNYIHTISMNICDQNKNKVRPKKKNHIAQKLHKEINKNITYCSC